MGVREIVAPLSTYVDKFLTGNRHDSGEEELENGSERFGSKLELQQTCYFETVTTWLTCAFFL